MPYAAWAMYRGHIGHPNDSYTSLASLGFSFLYGLMMSGRKRSSRDRSFNHPFDILVLFALNLTLNLTLTQSLQLPLSNTFVPDLSRGIIIVRCTVALASIRLIANIYNVRP